MISERNTREIHVLSVGQCGADAPQITSLLKQNFKAAVETAHTLSQALTLAVQKEYHLILLNRILDQTGEEGLELIGMMKNAGISRKVMLVSNYPEAQQHAISMGAYAGFGKSALRNPKTVEVLQKALGAPEVDDV